MGKSLLPILQGKERAGHETLYFTSVRTAPTAGPWKLVSAARRWELYNLDEDRTELNDLAANIPSASRPWPLSGST